MVRCDGVTKIVERQTFLSDGSNSRHGITFVGALQVLFIGLKLAKVIDWPWPIVFLPLILNVILIVGVLALLGVIYFIENR